MTRFKNKKDFQNFLDESYICLCDRPLTGLHEQNCQRIKREWVRLSKSIIGGKE